MCSQPCAAELRSLSRPFLSWLVNAEVISRLYPLVYQMTVASTSLEYVADLSIDIKALQGLALPPLVYTVED